MRDTVAAQVLPPGGAITVAMQEENNASLLSEMQEILQEQLAIRDEALHILQTKLLTVTSHAVFARMASCSHMSQVTAVANDAAAKSQSIADRVMKMIHDFETRLDTVRAEVKAVKVVLEGKTDLLDVESAVERGIVEKADASSLEEKADKVWVSQMVEALATAVKQMEEDNNAVAVRGGRECVERFSGSRLMRPVTQRAAKGTGGQNSKHGGQRVCGWSVRASGTHARQLPESSGWLACRVLCVSVLC